MFRARIHSPLTYTDPQTQTPDSFGNEGLLTYRSIAIKI